MEYYLIPKEKLLSLESISYNHLQNQMIDAIVANSKLIDLSDESIESKAKNRYGDKMYSFAQQREGYSAALKQLNNE